MILQTTVAGGESVEIVSWSNGTDEQVVAMLKAHYDGKINIHDYWSVGDVRSVALSAMAATSVGETHAAQQVEFILMNAGGKTLASGDECAFVAGMKDSLAETGYIESSNYTSGWKNSARRSWCNSTFRESIPSTLRPAFQLFSSVTNGASVTSAEESSDFFALPAEMEVTGAGTFGSAAAEGSLSQFDWYKTQSNRLKRVGEVANNWWMRTRTHNNYSYYGYCDVSSAGFNGYESYPTYTFGISPFGCI